jgi:two-component system chemotaxis response regulator CheY
MNCIVLDQSAEIRDSLCYILLSLGVKGLPAASRGEALALVQQDPEVGAAIIDVDNKKVGGLELFRELKADEKTKGICIVLHSGQSAKDFVVEMVELGIVGYLLKPYDAAQATVKLKGIVQRLVPPQKEKRQHIRIAPEPDELLRLHFRLVGQSNLISGRIRNISMGGVAVELFNPSDAELMRPGIKIPKLEFTINAKQLSVSAAVVLIKERVLAVRFLSLSSEDKANLARYIFKRIS